MKVLALAVTMPASAPRLRHPLPRQWRGCVMSEFQRLTEGETTMTWRGEVEDGTGWGGLVASKAEQRAEAQQAALERDARCYRKLRAGKYSHAVARSILNDTPHGIDAAVDALPATTRGSASVGRNRSNDD
jgi:hypothetical protein